MAHCVTCGNELHPERAEKYDYCTKRECREQNAKPLTVVSVGVNKAADQYLILNDRTKGDLAAGKYQDQRKSASVTGERSGPKRIPAARAAAKRVPRAGVLALAPAPADLDQIAAGPCRHLQRPGDVARGDRREARLEQIDGHPDDPCREAPGQAMTSRRLGRRTRSLLLE